MELGDPLLLDLKLKIKNDTMSFEQNGILRKVKIEREKEYLYFPDHTYQYRMYWKVLERNNDTLIIERPLPGFCKLLVKLKFEKI